MNRVQTVRARFSYAMASLAVASLIGLGGCGGGAETPKKAALPTEPAKAGDLGPAFPSVPAESAKKPVGKAKTTKPAR